MKRTWILVAHRGGARFFEHTTVGSGIKLVHEIDHPEGKLLDKEIKSDRPGRSYTSPGLGVHTMSPEEAPRERVLANFTRSLADRLEKATYDGVCDDIVLIAEPHFLGKLRGALKSDVSKLVTLTIDRDLVHAKEEEILERLKAHRRM